MNAEIKPAGILFISVLVGAASVLDHPEKDTLMSSRGTVDPEYNKFVVHDVVELSVKKASHRADEALCAGRKVKKLNFAQKPDEII